MLKKFTTKKGNLILPLLAVVVLVAAIFVVISDNGEKKNIASGNQSTSDNENQEHLYSLDDNGNLVIELEDMDETALFASYDSNGVNMEVIVIKDDDEVRAAMNTCQVCNGSPYAYFEQVGDSFVCQNCRNIFSSDQVGVTRGGCNPMPLEELEVVDGQLIISSEKLASYESNFTRWKQFQ